MFYFLLAFPSLTAHDPLLCTLTTNHSLHFPLNTNPSKRSALLSYSFNLVVDPFPFDYHLWRSAALNIPSISPRPSTACSQFPTALSLCVNTLWTHSRAVTVRGFSFFPLDFPTFIVFLFFYFYFYFFIFFSFASWLAKLRSILAVPTDSDLPLLSHIP